MRWTRDAQFHYRDARMKEHMLEQSPVISVDTKKKELFGDFKNPGQELRPKTAYHITLMLKLVTE